MRSWGFAWAWVATATGIISIGLFSDGNGGGGVEGNCLSGDIMYIEGDSIGYIGLECINETSFDASLSTCGADGVVVRTEEERSCPSMVPFCVQCGPRGWGSALCLSTPTTNRDCADADADADADTTNTTATIDDTSIINPPEDATKCQKTSTCESCVERELAYTLEEESRKGCTWHEDGGCTLLELELELSSPANATNETKTSSMHIMTIADCPVVGTRGSDDNITSSGPRRMVTSSKRFIQGVLSLSTFLFM